MSPDSASSRAHEPAGIPSSSEACRLVALAAESPAVDLLSRERRARRLTLVPASEDVALGLSLPPEVSWGALSTSPFRPGELPGLHVVELSTAVRDRAVASAQLAGIPLALWIRIAVEAADAVRDAALRCHVAEADVESFLDGQVAAGGADGARLSTLATVRLRSYAKHVSGGIAADAGRADERVELFLPDALAGRWEVAAAQSGRSLAVWVEDQVLQAPARCVLWEVAAARSCHSLTEWVYAALLKR